MKWLWGFQRDMDILRINGFASYMLKLIGKFAYISKKGKIDFYADEEKLDKKSLEFLEQIKRDKNFTKNWTADADKKTASYLEFTESIYNNKDLKPLSNQQLYSIYKKFDELHCSLAPFAFFIRTIVHKVQPYFENAIKQKVRDPKKAADYFTILTSTAKESFLGEEERKFYTLALSILKNRSILNIFKKQEPILAQLPKNIQAKIIKHAEEFRYIPCGYFDEPPQNNEYYMHRLARIAKRYKKEKNTLSSLKELPKKLNKEQKEIESRLKLTQEEKQIMGCLRECVYYKDAVRGALNHGYYFMYPFFKELGRRLNHSSLEIKFLFPEELEEYLLKNKDHSDLIKKRMDYHVIVVKNGRLVTVFDEEARRLEKEIESKITKDIKEIRGQTACPGYAKAKARVIKHPSEIQNEAHDFILVTSMTTPEFVVAMQKALAIVTDEGGITCHAAIVSREMNKPCIIGTNIATRAIKDGEIIEVDATKGIIRKAK